MIGFFTPVTPRCCGSRDRRATWMVAAVSIRAILGWGFFYWIVPVYARGEENNDVKSEHVSREAVVSAQQIHQWIRQLDDDRYAVREAAQQRLVSAGSLALEAVAVVAADQGASLESITRAVRILTAWSDSKDASLRLAALERLGSLTNRPLEAALATEMLAALYEQSAIEAIQRLGGLCEPVNQLPVNARISNLYKNRQALRVTLGANWKGTDEDLKSIAQIRRTTVVSLYSAPIGDQALVHLTKIPALTRVEIYGTQLSEESIAAFRKQLPETVKTVDIRRSGAKLGIGGKQVQGAAQVATVLPGSAADRGGLQQHDVITHLAGEPVDSFESLTKRIATYQPGDTVELTIRRKNQTLTKNVTFDRWGAAEAWSEAGGERSR